MIKVKILLFLICLFIYKPVYAETLSNHSTMSHTKSEIIKRYNVFRSRFNYSNSVYNESPSTSVP